MYLARGLHKTHQHLDEDEFLQVEKIPLKEAAAMVLDGRLPDGKSQIALLKYLLLTGGEK